jgi:hypothetical protein
MVGRIAITLLVAGIGASASADYHSSASDSNSDGPTFLGGRQVAGRFRDAQPVDPSGNVTANFLWDSDEDGPGPAVLIPSTFRFQADFTSHSVANVGGAFLNIYTCTGFAEFRTFDLLGQLVLRIDFTNAVFTSLSTNSNFWGASATLQDQSRSDAGLQFTAGPGLPGANYTNQIGDFAFTLTNLRQSSGGGVALDANGNPTTEWRSEGSFSSHVAPTPGALALLSLSSLAATRRRR